MSVTSIDTDRQVVIDVAEYAVLQRIVGATEAVVTQLPAADSATKRTTICRALQTVLDDYRREP